MTALLCSADFKDLSPGFSYFGYKEETLGKGFRVSVVEICCGQNIDCYFKVENLGRLDL